MDIAVGDEIPVWVREAGFHAWNRYAAVNDEFVPIHMDDEAGKASGYPGAFGMGNLQLAWLHCMLREWIEPVEGRIVRVACEFRAPSLKGNVVTAHGMVTAVRDEGDERFVDLDVWTDTADGTRLAPGSATVAFPN
ncbi:MAG: MaoC/PaaZ C-terminal domain-containing protein [Acidimicrobiia bacterium]